MRCRSVGVEHHDRAQCGRLLDRALPAGELVGPLEERHRRLGVTGHERDLLGRERVVDRHRDRGRVHAGDVGEQVLGAVGRHDRDRLAGLDAQRHQARGAVESGLAHLRPGERAPARAVDTDLVGVRRGVGVLVGGVGQGVDEGASLDLGLDLLAGNENVGHGAPFTVRATCR